MKLKDAIQRGRALVKRRDLGPEDTVAVHVLVEMAQRVQRARKPLLALHKALNPGEADLNQVDLFGRDDSG